MFQSFSPGLSSSLRLLFDDLVVIGTDVVMECDWSNNDDEKFVFLGRSGSRENIFFVNYIDIPFSSVQPIFRDRIVFPELDVRENLMFTLLNLTKQDQGTYVCRTFISGQESIASKSLTVVGKGNFDIFIFQFSSFINSIKRYLSQLFSM